LQYYFTYHFRHVPYDYCILKGFSKLAPGCNLYFTLKDGVRIERYWNPTFKKISDPRDFPKVLTDSVKRACVSDVPIGLLLSGGVDSSALAFLLKDKGVKTYSIGFDGGDVELKRAERVVCIWGLV